jgi:hypothetical protein
MRPASQRRSRQRSPSSTCARARSRIAARREQLGQPAVGATRSLTAQHRGEVQHRRVARRSRHPRENHRTARAPSAAVRRIRERGLARRKRIRPAQALRPAREEQLALPRAYATIAAESVANESPRYTARLRHVRSGGAAVDALLLRVEARQRLGELARRGRAAPGPRVPTP